MSSAILYAAIIVIWACVLVPRWLKRDSARSAAESAAETTTAADTTDALPAEGADLSDAVSPDAASSANAAGSDAVGSDAVGSDAVGSDEAPVVSERGAGLAVAPIVREESRRRVLKARRRLLWMLLGLATAACVLAGTGLAAWWVIAPPTVMLAGYLLVLREASKADAEASEREHGREREAGEARQAAREREHARRARAGQASVGPAVPVTYAAAPVPADYDDDGGPGRDFTLDRRYAATAAAVAAAAVSAEALAAEDEDDAYDQYTENRLRAVGD